MDLKSIALEAIEVYQKEGNVLAREDEKIGAKVIISGSHLNNLKKKISTTIGKEVYIGNAYSMTSDEFVRKVEYFNCGRR